MQQKIQAAREYISRHPLLFTALSMGWNLVFALINGVISIIYTSYWYLTLAAFYFLLGLMKMMTVTLSRSKRRTESDLLRHNGFAMFGLSVIICGLMILTIRELHNPVKSKLVMVITAAYTLGFACVTVCRTIMAHLKSSTVMICCRNISCASALASVLSLERSMLSTFGDAAGSFSLLAQAITGGASFLALILLGTGMLILSRRARSPGPC